MSSRIDIETPIECGSALWHGEKVRTMARIETNADFDEYWIVETESGKLKIAKVKDLEQLHYYGG